MPEAQRRALGRPYHKDRFAYDEDTDSYICHTGTTATLHQNKAHPGDDRCGSTGPRGPSAEGVRSSGCVRGTRHGRALEIGPHDTALRRHRSWIVAAMKPESCTVAMKGLVRSRCSGSSKSNRGRRRFHDCGASTTWPPSGACWPRPSILRTLWRVWHGKDNPTYGAAISSHRCCATQSSAHPA